MTAAADLAAALSSAAPPVVLDVRWRLIGVPGRESYAAGHVPGAVFVDLDADLAAPPGPGRHPLPSADAFQAAMRRCGVSASREVVVYDDADASSAARAWWLLRYFGHPAVRVLDGGYAAWAALGLPVSQSEPDVVPGDFVAAPGGMPVLDASAALRVATEGVLLDARSAERFRGENEPVDPVAGRIPGAVSAPTSGNVDDAGRLLPREALRERFEELGVDGTRLVGAYCGSGVTASQVVLALEVAGYEGALYAGSWSEWITDPSRPVATGPESPSLRGGRPL